MQGRWDNTTSAITGGIFDKYEVLDPYSPWSGATFDVTPRRKTINFSPKRTNPLDYAYYPTKGEKGIMDRHNMLYKSRKCGQTEKMRQIINIQLAQGKDVLVVDPDGYDYTISGTKRFGASVLQQRATCRITGLKEKETPKDMMDGLIREYNANGDIWKIDKEKIYKQYHAKAINFHLQDEGDVVKTEPIKWNNCANTGELRWNDSQTLTNNTLDMNGNGLTNLTYINFNKRPCVNISLKGKDNTYYVEMIRAGDGGTINFYSDRNYRNKLKLPKGDVVKAWDFAVGNDIEEAPIDLIASVNRSFALEAINEESKAVLEMDSSPWDKSHWRDNNLASRIPTSNLMIDTDGISTWATKPLLVESKRPNITIRLKGAKYHQEVLCGGVLTYEGLCKAKETLEDEGYF